MTPVELAALVQVFIDAYVLGKTRDTRLAFEDGAGGGIRRRFPAIVGGPPEYEPLPSGLDRTPFLKGEGPEPFDEPSAVYMDRCPLERVICTASETGVHLKFFFVVRYAPRQFDPKINAAVCLPSGDECLSIISECLNRVQDFLGADSELVGNSESLAPALSSEFELLTNDDFLRLELPNVALQ